MSHIGDCIVDLPLVEGAPAPVSEPSALVETVTQQRLDQVRIADLLAMPERHGSDLRIEEGVGDLAGKVMDDLQVLAAGMEDLENLVVGHEQVEQRLKVDIGLGINC